MKELKARILQDGRCFPGGILKVDNFINHQMERIVMNVMKVVKLVMENIEQIFKTLLACKYG